MRTSALGTDHFTLEEGLWFFFILNLNKNQIISFLDMENRYFLIRKNIVEKIQAQIIIVISGHINNRSLIHNNIYVVYLFSNFHKISKSKMKVLCIYMYIETETQKIDLI